jgi:hypothetical protein
MNELINAIVDLMEVTDPDSPEGEQIERMLDELPPAGLAAVLAEQMSRIFGEK